MKQEGTPARKKESKQVGKRKSIKYSRKKARLKSSVGTSVAHQKEPYRRKNINKTPSLTSSATLNKRFRVTRGGGRSRGSRGVATATEIRTWDNKRNENVWDDPGER